MKKLRVTIAIILTVSMLFSMSGCAFRFTSFDNLIRPPKPFGKLEGLQEEFEKSVGEEFNLLTPENGEYNSAFVTYDMDSDGVEEALVFYSTKAQKDAAKFSYFDYNNDDEVWSLVEVFDGLGNAVDQVVFYDLNHDNRVEMIIGWNLFSSKTNRIFGAYSFNKGSLVQFSSYSYTYLDILDVNSDGLDDILTLTVDSSVPEHLTASATVYNYKNSFLDILGVANLDGNISSYSSVSSEIVGDTKLIYIESNKGQTESLTEIIYWDEKSKSLVAPLFDVASQSTVSTWRNIPLTVFDIDDDKFLEIPLSVEMPGSSDTISADIKSGASQTGDDNSPKLLYFIKWSKYRNGKFKPVQYSVVNATMGYRLDIVKSSWVGRITVIGLDGQWSFYRWNSYDSTVGDFLFSIYAYDKNNNRESEKYSEWNELTSDNEKTFVYQISDAGRAFGVTDNILKDNFIIDNFGGLK